MAMKGSRLCFYLKLYFIFITTASVFSFQVHVSGFIQFSIFQGLDLVVYLSGFRYSFFYPSGFISSFISIRVQTQFSILQGLDLVFYPSGFISSFLSFRVQMQCSILTEIDLVVYPSGFISSFLYLQGLDLVFNLSGFRSSFLYLQGLDLVFYTFRVQIQVSYLLPLLQFSVFRSMFQGLELVFNLSRFRSSFLSLKVLIQLSILLGLFLVFYPSGF